METKIQENHKSKFIPFFQTVIDGVPTKVTLNDAEANPEKYINSPIGPLYQDWKKLKKEINSRKAKPEFERLNMNNADSLGEAFDKEKRLNQKNQVTKYLDKQKKKRNRLMAKAKKNFDAEQAIKLEEEKAAKKKKEENEAAKKAAEKAKKQEEERIKKAQEEAEKSAANVSEEENSDKEKAISKKQSKQKNK